MTGPQKTVLITGATGDFGRAFARKFFDGGYSLILHGRNAEKLAALQEEFPGSQTLCFDITDSDAVIEVLADVPTVDVLVNNAGGAIGQDAAFDSKLSDWMDMIDSNVRGLVAVTHALLPKMVEAGRGHIINIGSVAGNYCYPGGHVYNGYKAFVKQFSGALRADLIGQNIRVTNIEPGIAETQFSLVRFKGDADRAAAVYANTDALKAEDVAESVFWAAMQPPHVNVSRLEIMSTMQATGPLSVYRKTSEKDS